MGNDLLHMRIICLNYIVGAGVKILLGKKISFRILVKAPKSTGYCLLQSGCSCTSTFETGLGWLYDPAL